MTGKPRKMSGSAADRAAWDERWKHYADPPRYMGGDGVTPPCGGLHPGQYVAGIDFYCNGSASRSRTPHDRVTVGRFRHSTCEKYAGFRDGQWWMVPLKDGTLPEDAAPDGIVRMRLDCTSCTFNHVLKPARVDELMREIWQEHARRVEPRNVSKLLN